MNKVNFDHGDRLIKDFSEKHGISPKTSVEIILDVHTINRLWDWVNIEDYLYLRLQKEGEL